MNTATYTDGEARGLPQNLDAERATLGAMIVTNDRIDDVVSLVHPGMFYRAAHATICRHVYALRERREPVDYLTLAESLRASGELDSIGGQVYLGSLVDGLPRSSNAQHYAQIVKDKYTSRQIIHAARKAMERAYDSQDVPQTVLDATLSDLFTIAEGQSTGGDLVDAATLMAEVTAELDRRAALDVLGLPSGFAELDNIIGGFQPGNLYYIPARPGMGKSALMQAIAVHAATAGGAQVAVFSLEMDRVSIGMRMLSSESNVSTTAIQRPKGLRDSDWTKLSATRDRLALSGIWVDDSSSPTLIDIRAKARRHKAKHGLGMICVDYIQLMDTLEDAPRGKAAQRKLENRNQELSALSRGFKLLARDLHVPVIVLSQLSREPDKRANHRPQLSDIRDSGSLEQDADVVIFPYRAYEYTQKPEDRNIAEFIIGKHRNGPTGSVVVSWIPHLTRFEDQAGNERRRA